MDRVNKSEISAKLREVTFFIAYRKNDKIMDQIASLCKLKHIKNGKSIITEGESGDEIYIILKGEIEVVKKTLQKEEYTVHAQNASISSIYVGEVALIDNEKRSATVIAKTDCDCLVITRKDFINFGNKNPKIGLDITRLIAKQLSQNLRKANEDVITLFSALVDEISVNE